MSRLFFGFLTLVALCAGLPDGILASRALGQESKANSKAKENEQANSNAKGKGNAKANSNAKGKDNAKGKSSLGATAADAMHVPDGFVVELLYEVPSQAQGSWVALTSDPQGRLIASDQYGSLYRITVSETSTQDGDAVSVQQLDGDFGMAHGLLHAFGSLYINVNGQPANKKNGQREVKSGIYRLTDTTGDDQYDQVEHLVPLQGRGEHGPHALVLSPDGKQIYIAAGNTTDLPAQVPHSRVPRHWSEDHLLGSMPDARGHNAGRLAPGGWVAKMDPDGGNFELIATGFRNEYDIAFNPQGELFTYDADMEWDVGTAWYRPTRVNHVTSGGEFGWRNGAGKWPAYYPDSLGSVVDIGPGSPTGIAFGTGAKFPAKYQRALFICDWSYGNIFAVHLTPDGSSYRGSFETFATAAPLPVTDLVVRPQDGMLYFTIGGRRTQSALYRVRYVGDESTDAANSVDDSQAVAQRNVRHELEKYHGPADPQAVPLAIKHLSSNDRDIRFAARIALEHQPVDQWRSGVLDSDDANTRIHGVVGLARCGSDLQGQADAQQRRTAEAARCIDALTSLPWSSLTQQQQIDLLRAYGLVFIRLAKPNEAQRAAVLKQLDSHLPTGDADINRELSQVLIYLNAPKIASRVVALLKKSPTQEDQMRYAFALRDHVATWDDQSRNDYFQWFRDVMAARGGMSFGGFLKNIRNEAIKHLDDQQKQQLGQLLTDPPVRDPLADLEPRELVQKWTVADLENVETSIDKAPDLQRGKQMFAVGQCYKCHRIDGQGGILGPDLTGTAGRFTTKDLLVSIIEPSKEISDQYGATQFLTLDGQSIVGKVVNMSGNELKVLTNMLDPSSLKAVKRDDIDVMEPAKLSMMPNGLLDTLTKDEIRDLIAYLKSAGKK